ncbi:MAG: NAD(P)-dependent oxidoreductase, partial [bacterium]|nr:NAD(P)-dependent oxidoreductase [bacterium]
MKEVLLTGGLGFIGRNLLAELLKKDVKICLLVRPNTQLPAYVEHELIHPVSVDLEQFDRFDDTLKERHFDTVFHIGAVRGGRDVSRRVYKRVNVDATEALARVAIKKSAKFIYCSSVGVFGAIPKELPPSEAT